LPHLPEVRVEAIEENVARLMPRPALIPVSARTGQGIDRWLDWLAGHTV
jgi:hydrogenase nickel incorporation protein HypB